MGIKKNADASYNLGLGVSDANDYKGFAGQNEITIQLTADGATDKSMDALNYLKTFAINQAAAGLPIKPSASVSISANGYTKALEADDFEITETGVKIGGIEYTASTDSWDFTNALVPSGGGGGAYIVNAVTDEDTQIITLDKTFLEIETAYLAGKPVIVYYTAIEYVDVTPYEVYYKNLVIETYRYPDNSPYGCGVHVSPHSNNTDYYHADSINGYPYFDPND